VQFLRNDLKRLDHKKGRDAEALALHYLLKLGYRLCKQNYRVRWGELDLVMEDGRTLVFVEVKYRSLSEYPIESSVGPGKLRRLRRAMLEYLVKNGAFYRPSRFDCVFIIGRGSKFHDKKNMEFEIIHFKNATDFN